VGNKFINSKMVIISWTIAILASVFSAYFLVQLKNQKVSFEKGQKEKIKETAKKLIRNKYKRADQEVKELRKQAKNYYNKVKAQYKLQLKELEKKEQLIEQQRKNVSNQEISLIQQREEVAETRKKLLVKLEKLSGMSKIEAKEQYTKEFEASLASYQAKHIAESAKVIRESAEETARELIVDAMQSVSIDYIDEISISSIEIKSEDIKGKVIGKEGRNIRAFEKITGVDIMIDESPTSIGLSSYDAVRREIAKITLLSLIKDGRIHPVSIEEHYAKAKLEVVNELKKTGKMMAEKANWYDVPEELTPIIGRLKFRRSKGQSMVEHTLEVMAIGEYVARELKADVDVVLKACLLHDIGKTLKTKTKRPHHHISGDVARKYGLDDVIVNAIEAHHEDIEPKSVEAVIVKIADAASGSRRGARKENVEDYIQRIESLEKAAYDVAGDAAEEVFAVRAGRELRVMVKPGKISDEESVVLAHKIAKEIDKTGAFQGIVNVVVVRELRAHASSGNTSK